MVMVMYDDRKFLIGIIAMYVHLCVCMCISVF